MDVILYILLGLLAVFLTVVLVRAALFRPRPQPQVAAAPVSTDREKIIADMVDMIRCKTVSYRDHTLEDAAEFEKFQQLLVDRFPRIHAACTLKHLGRNGLLYHLPGQAADKPTVLMAHYDVVPVEQENWEKPAFDGIIEDGELWGRGTLDTKGTLCGVMEALEQMLGEGYVPQQDLYLSFSGEEEIDGDTCPAIVSYLEQQGIAPALVLDEGGAVVDNVFPGVPGRCALVGVAEKGVLNLSFTLETKAGHASTPPVRTALGQMGRALARIESHPFRYYMCQPVRELFDTLGRHSTFLYRVLFANLWCFAPVLDLFCRLTGGEINALMRTTVAATRMSGGDAFNVLPGKAWLGANVRLLGNNTIDYATKYLRKVIANDRIQIEVVNGTNPSRYSRTDCAEWDTVVTAIRQTWPDALVSPYLMMACSDSRHYCRISDRVYRFCAMHLTKEQRAMIHGVNERIPLDTLVQTVEFYLRLLQKI